VDYHGWTSYLDWLFGVHRGKIPVPAPRPGVRIARATGTLEYTDPHTGLTATWESASWTSPVRRLPQPASELVASWNADTPAGTWIQVELLGTYTDGTATPAYVMGRWTAGDGPDDIRRTSVTTRPMAEHHLDRHLRHRRHHRRSAARVVPAAADAAAPARHRPDTDGVAAGRDGLRHPRPVRGARLGAGVAAGVELAVPRYSQNIHKGQYPEYDNGGEAWCSPTSSTMVIEYWGRGPTAADVAWVDPAYADPQVDQAPATRTTTSTRLRQLAVQRGLRATYADMQGVITRLHSLGDVERLIKAAFR